jgi:PAS domain S-box-containing protein
MFKENPAHVLLFCIIVLISTAVLQFMNPGVGFFDYGLILVILLTVFLKNNLYTKLFGIAGLAMISVSAFYDHGDQPKQEIITQHAFIAVSIILTVLAVLYIKKLYQSIESDEMQVKALFDHATEGIVLTNREGKIILINPAAAQLFAYSQEELLGKSIEVLIPGRFHAAHLGYRKGFYQDPSNRAMGHGRDLFAKKKDGIEFPVEVSLSFYNQENEFFVIAFVVDITSRKESEQEMLKQKRQLELITEDMKKLNADLETKVEQRTLILREALQELEKSQLELNEALSKEKELGEIKSRFVSMASHEFRTPLSTVLSSASLISKYINTEDQDKRDKHIKRIKDSVKHLNTLLEDFLSLGKLEEGKVKASVGEFNVREFMEEVVDEMKSILKEGQTIRPIYDGELMFVSDKRLLKNILLNLLSNAVKFSPENSAIDLEVKNGGPSLSLIVKDRGIGISEEDMTHLFSSFFRGKNVLNIEGTGLGLNIVKRYAELLHGNISLQSKLNEGTTVFVEVPNLPLPIEESFQHP